MAHRILVVEDEQPLAEAIAFNLREENFTAQIAADGLAALDAFRKDRPDLVILDLMLPGIDGLELCRIIRRDSDCPIIMLTAKSREVDKVVGLGVGADDYVTKPFGMLELIARVRAALRRAEGRVAEGRGEVLRTEGLELDVERHTVTVRGEEVDLRPREFDLLRILMANRGRVLKRDLLLDRVWGETEYIDPGTLDVHVRRLREKIEDDPSKPRFVLTVRGLGYKFRES